MTLNGWGATLTELNEADRKRVVDDVASNLKDLSLTEMRSEREKLIARVVPLVQSSLNRFGLQSMDLNEIARDIVARIGGLGFLEPLLRSDSNLSEV